MADRHEDPVHISLLSPYPIKIIGVDRWRFNTVPPYEMTHKNCTLNSNMSYFFVFRGAMQKDFIGLTNCLDALEREGRIEAHVYVHQCNGYLAEMEAYHSRTQADTGIVSEDNSEDSGTSHNVVGSVG